MKFITSGGDDTRVHSQDQTRTFPPENFNSFAPFTNNTLGSSLNAGFPSSPSYPTGSVSPLQGGRFGPNSPQAFHQQQKQSISSITSFNSTQSTLFPPTPQLFLCPQTLCNSAGGSGVISPAFSNISSPNWAVTPVPDTNTDWDGVGNIQQLESVVLSGKKKALIIGINYLTHPTARLSACINDAKCMKYLLQTKFGFQEQQIVLLTDDNPNPIYMPTRQNIINSFGWLLHGVQPGDSIFFYFSGHGSQQEDTGGDEQDGLDETICPTDWETEGMILDDLLHADMCAKVPKGACLTAVMDCCHSGTGLDLPHTYFRNKEDVIEYELDDTARRNNRETVAQVVLFSGCSDSQTSADAINLSGGVFTGAATFSFIQAIERYYPNLTFEFLLESMSAALKVNGYEQTIFMSSGHAMSLSLPFNI